MKTKVRGFSAPVNRERPPQTTVAYYWGSKVSIVLLTLCVRGGGLFLIDLVKKRAY